MCNSSDGYKPKSKYFGYLLKTLPQFYDKSCSEQKINNTEFIMPKSIYGRRVGYDLLEYDPLLDSSDMNMTDWAHIAQTLGENYEKYDAFIVIHGTDTMAYTASALSFCLQDLRKTVIITGSQVPM